MARKPLIPLSLFLLFLIPSHLKAQAIKALGKPPSSKDYSVLIRNLDSLICIKMDSAHIKGASIALVDDQNVVWQKGYGYTDSTKTTRVTEQTLFSTQSVSKTYTATAFLMAVNKGLYKIDDPVKTYYPSFTVQSRFGKQEAGKITFRHLLSHRAGLCQEALVGSNYDTVHCSFDAHIKSISKGWLRFPVGRFYSYSNAGPDITGYIISSAAGMSVAGYMKKNLLEPLGMKNSTYDQEEAYASGNLAKGYYGNVELKKTYIADVAGGGLYSSVNDMARFLSFQFNGCKLSGKAVISPDLLAQMQTVQFKLKGQKAGYGLGVMLKEFNGLKLVYHIGGGYGYSALQVWIPEVKVGVIILTNSAEGYPFNQEIFKTALSGMIRAKFGFLPVAVKTSHPPLVSLSDPYLKPLTGTYKTGRKLVQLIEVHHRLALVSASDTSLFTAASEFEFVSENGDKLIFHLTAAGRPAYFIDLNENDADFYIFNDAPNEKPGLNKPSWRALTGTYKGYVNRQEELVRLYMKNGYLYSSSGGATKVRECKPGIYFTTDGESLLKKGNKIILGNRSYTKE